MTPILNPQIPISHYIVLEFSNVLRYISQDFLNSYLIIVLFFLFIRNTLFAPQPPKSPLSPFFFPIHLHNLCVFNCSRKIKISLKSHKFFS